jgi:hypothetical protein
LSLAQNSKTSKNIKKDLKSPSTEEIIPSDKRSQPLFAGTKAGSSKMNNDDVLESPTKNKRKRKSTIPAVDSPTMATRGKRGNK